MSEEESTTVGLGVVSGEAVLNSSGISEGVADAVKQLKAFGKEFDRLTKFSLDPAVAEGFENVARAGDIAAAAVRGVNEALGGIRTPRSLGIVNERIDTMASGARWAESAVKALGGSLDTIKTPGALSRTAGNIERVGEASRTALAEVDDLGAALDDVVAPTGLSAVASSVSRIGANADKAAPQIKAMALEIDGLADSSVAADGPLGILRDTIASVRDITASAARNVIKFSGSLDNLAVSAGKALSPVDDAGAAARVICFQFKLCTQMSRVEEKKCSKTRCWAELSPSFLLKLCLIVGRTILQSKLKVKPILSPAFRMLKRISSAPVQRGLCFKTATSFI